MNRRRGRAAGSRRCDDERAAVVGVGPALDELPLLETVEDAGQRRAAVPEARVELRDARFAALVQVREDVRFGLGDVELRIGERQRDRVRRAVDLRDERKAQCSATASSACCQYGCMCGNVTA